MEKYWTGVKLIVVGVVCAALIFGAGFGVGKWGCKGEPAVVYGQRAVLVIDDQTRGETARRLSELTERCAILEATNDGLNAKLIAAVHTEMELKATIAKYDTHEAVPGYHTWKWEERGGGTGVFEMSSKSVEMSFDQWRIDLDVELSRLSDGRILALAHINDDELTLTETKFYMDDPCRLGFFDRFTFGGYVGGGMYGGNLHPTAEVTAGFVALERRRVTPMFKYGIGPGLRSVTVGVQVNPF